MVHPGQGRREYHSSTGEGSRNQELSCGSCVGTKSLAVEAVEAATLVTLGVAEPLCEARRVGMLQVRPRTADVGRMHPGFGHLALQVSPIRAVSSQYRPAKL